MMLNGKLSEQTMLVRDTNGNASGLWRTPDTCAGGTMSPEMSDYVAENKLKRPSGTHHSLRLQDQVRNPKLWPTPRAREGNAGQPGSKGSIHNAERGYLDGMIQEQFPTPTQRDYKGARKPETLKAKGRNATNSLPDHVRQETSGQLNPTWVEWLMGFPSGWTDLED
jgi:hypothetical protein